MSVARSTPPNLTRSNSQQVRSRDKESRILEVVQEILEEGGNFAQVKVVEIIDRAEVSIGAFYARFGSKEAVLTALCDEVATKRPTLSRFTPEYCEGKSAIEIIREWIALDMKWYRKHRSMLRYMRSLSYGYVGDTDPIEPLNQSTLKSLNLVRPILEERIKPRDSKQFTIALECAYNSNVGFIQERIFSVSDGGYPTIQKLSDKMFGDMLARLFVHTLRFSNEAD